MKLPQFLQSKTLDFCKCHNIKVNEINSGYCEEWVNYIRQFISCIKIWDDVWGSHCFLKINNKYYDCLNLDGVKDINDLTFYKKNVYPERVKIEYCKIEI